MIYLYTFYCFLQSDCSGANFYRADITFADFSWSDLSVANMQARYLELLLINDYMAYIFSILVYSFILRVCRRASKTSWTSAMRS